MKKIHFLMFFIPFFLFFPLKKSYPHSYWRWKMRYYSYPPPYYEPFRIRFFWGFNIGVGSFYAENGFFGCTSPEINSGLNFFSIDTGIKFTRFFSIFGRLSMGFSSFGGHTISSGALQLILRGDIGRFFAYIGAGSSVVEASQFPDEYGYDDLTLEEVKEILSLGVGYSLIKERLFALELEAGIEVPSKNEQEDDKRYSIAQVSLGFKW